MAPEDIKQLLVVAFKRTILRDSVLSIEPRSNTGVIIYRSSWSGRYLKHLLIITEKLNLTFVVLNSNEVLVYEN
ncbi:MAG: hypothetical protein JST26_16075 [Bacteroidetes bacterium]|nr:hypothetical protein [Bacteroidota bacterium]